MIKECNFKEQYELIGYKDRFKCELADKACDGEDKCIVYQMYKMLSSRKNILDSILGVE